MTYFKKLTESRQISSIKHFESVLENQEDYSEEYDEMVRSSGPAQLPYRPFRCHNHQKLFKKHKYLVSGTFQERMRMLKQMVPQSSTRPELYDEARMRRRQKEFEQSRVERVQKMEELSKKVTFSQNTSPVKLPQDFVSNSMNMSQQLFSNLIKVIEKLADDRTSQSRMDKCPCLHDFTPQHNSLHNTIYHGIRSPQSETAKQPPIIINNIIKPQDRVYHDQVSYSRREPLDDKLFSQEMHLKKLQNGRRNQSVKLNSTGKQSLAETLCRNTPLNTIKTISLDKQIMHPGKETSVTCIEDDNNSEKDIIQEIRREEMLSRIDNEGTEEQKPKRKARQFAVSRKQNIHPKAIQPKPPLSSNKKQPEKEIKEPLEIKPPVSFDFPVNSDFDRPVSLAEAFQMRKGNVHSRQKPKKERQEKSKEELAQLRREMMKRKTTEEPKEQSFIQMNSQQLSRAGRDLSNASSKRQPSKQLMDRLIYGIKAKVDEDQMKALTTKNYQQLPEVRRKRQQQQKKEDFQKRMQAKKEFEQSLRLKR